MKNKWFLQVVGLIVLLGFSVSIFAKASFDKNSVISDLQDYENFTINLIDNKDMGIENPYFNDNISSLSELEAKSDLIVKVSTFSKREKVSRAILTTLKIDEVIKGNTKLSEILYFEPSYFQAYQNDGTRGNFTTEGYQLLQEDQEYILFLQKLKAPAGYNMSVEEKKSFLPVSQFYSKFPLRSGNQSLKPVTSTEVQFADIQNYEIITKSEGIIQQYRTIKGEVIKKYVDY